MEIWVGDVSIDGSSDRIQDVHFNSSHTVSQSLLPKECNLRALDVVFTSNVPFYLAAGPALSLSTNEAATEEFFSQILLGGDQEPPQDDGNSLPWWQRQLPPLPYGILLKVDPGAVECSTAATEILVYAAVDHNYSAGNGMITPPRSSSPDFGQSAVIETRPSPNNFCLKLYALPLDSRRLELLSSTKAGLLAGSATLSDGEARFLPFATISSEPQQGSNKRRKLSKVFDEANHQRRKIKGRGGESISRAMAEAGSQQPGRSVDIASQLEKPIFRQQPVTDQPVDLAPRNLSRASSTGSLPTLDSARPRSRRETFVAGRKTSLNRVESIISAPDSITTIDNDNIFSQQNKSTLARIVMAGMRMYGFQPQKKSKPQSPIPSTTKTPDLDPDPDEYKTIYHQTFKAASFTFRSHFSLHPVAQEAMREVVDRLLSLFCIDPNPSIVKKDAFGSQEEEARQDVFDQPSSKKLGEVVMIETPSSTRKGMGL